MGDILKKSRNRSIASYGPHDLFIFKRRHQPLPDIGAARFQNIAWKPNWAAMLGTSTL
jgi:hypothetical protein